MELDKFDKLSNREKENLLSRITVIYWAKRITACILLLAILLASGCPVYNVWQQGLEGEAELARAEQNRQILINEAKAKKESSIYWAEAEIERAKGAAEANKVMANSLGGSEDYLRWLYIEKLDEIKNGQIIYLPTEAGVPILEASRLQK